MKNYYHSILFLLVFLGVYGLAGSNAIAQTGFTITENLRTSSTEQLTLGEAAYLTAGVQDAEGEGWLRLTEATTNQAGYAIVNQAFPSGLGVLVDLEFVIWGGNGADGFSFFLFDAQYDPTRPVGDPLRFEIGGFGGSLGYANRDAVQGVTGGYIGIGVDEYGNYSNTTESKNGGDVTGGALRPNAIGIRGPASPASGAPYRWLGGNTDLAGTLGIPGFNLDHTAPTGGVRPASNVHYRRIQLQIIPVGGQYEVSARLKISEDGDFVQALAPFIINDVPPAFLKMGFAASTGGSHHIHEVRNLIITTPGGVRLQKEVDKPVALIGDELTYTVDLYNQVNSPAPDLAFEDIIPENFNVTNVVFDNKGNAGNTASGWSAGGDLTDVTVDLVPYGEAAFVITGTVTGMPTGGDLINTATLEVTPATGLSDPDDTNNTATATTAILSPSFTLEKTLTSINGDAGTTSYSAVGDVLEYTITVTNTGNAALSNIDVSDPKTGLSETIAELPSGATETFPTTYTITQADLNAGSFLNTATATGNDPLGNTVPPEDPEDGEETTPGTQNPSLRLVKAANFTGPVALGDVINYTFTASNEGNVTIENIVVSDPMLGGTIPNLSLATGSSWPSAVGTLAPGESVTLANTYTVLAGDVSPEGYLENTAEVSGDDPANPGETLTPQPSNTVIVSLIDNCDPASGSVDTDGDGIADICDLDDDNDGILDTDECPFVPSSVIVAHTDQGELVSYNTTTNNLTVLCSGIDLGSAYLGDIAMDRSGDIWGITSEGKLIRIDPDNCSVTEVGPDLGILGTALSFLPDGNLLVGSGSDAIVRKIDVVGGTYAISTWADFGAGFSNGDFIFIGNKAYVLWFDDLINATDPLLFEVTIDADFNYVSHTVSGTLPRFTWGLAKANGDQLFGVTGIGADGTPGPMGTIVRINTQPSFSWTLIASYHQYFYGATSVDESSLECDTDGDGIPNRLDPDSDNDGCPDAVEYYGAVDPIGSDVNPDGTVTDASYSGDYTNAITATQLSISTQPADATATIGSTAVFSATAGAMQATTFEDGLPDYSGTTAIDASAGLIYQWQESVDDGATWSDISDGGQYSGTTTDELTITNIALGQKDNQYRLVITHDVHICPLVSSAALLNIPSLSFAKTGVLSTDGNTIEYTFTVTNTGNVTMTDIEVADLKIDDNPFVLEATTLAPGESTTGTATYNIALAEKNTGEVENAATVTGTPPTTDPDNPAEPIDPVPSTPDVDNPGEPGEPGVPTVVDVPADPSLSFAKTGVLSTDGNTVTYTFTVTNTGNVTLTGVEITDPKINVDDITYGPWPTPATPGVLAPEESVLATATYTVTQPERDAGEVENTATVTGTPPFDPADPTQPGEPITPVPSTPDVDNPGTPGDPGVPTVVTVPADPALSFVKTGVLSTDGNTVTYTFTVTNTGNVTLTDVGIEDPKIATGDITYGAWPTPASPGVLAPTESVLATATYLITQPEKDAGEVENTATVTGTPPFDPADPTQPGDPITPVPSTPDVDNPGTPGDPGVPTVVTVPADPALSFAKTGVLSADGNTVTYTFTVTNTGNVTMTEVEITDAKLPDGVTLDATTLAPGAVATGTATYTISQPEKDAGEVENTATVTGTPPFDPADPTQPGEPITPVPSTPDVDNPGTPGDPEVPTVVTVPADPSLSFAKTGALSTDGNTIEYTFTVTNTGNVTLTDIEATDVKLPGGTVDNSTGTWPSTEGVLAPGESVELSASYLITQPEKDAGEVENAATVTGTPPFDPADPTQPGEPIDPVPSSPDVDDPGTPGDPEVPTVVTVPADPSLSFAKTGALSTDGNTIEYTFTVTNTGNVTLTGVVIDDPKIDAEDITYGAWPTPETPGMLAPEESVIATATYTVTQPEKDAGEVENAATVTGTPPFDPADPTQPGEPITPVPSTPDVDNPGTPGDPEVPTIVEVPGKPALSFAKTGVLSADGNTITYTFTVTNTGNVTLTEVEITDAKLPDGVTLDATTLAPGAVATGTATYTITQPEKDAGEVENNATVTGTPPFDPADPTQPGEPITPVPSTPDVDNPGTPGDPGVPTVVEVPADPALSFAKTGVLSTDGNTIEYTFTVTNTGNVTLTGVEITDAKLPDGVTLDATTLAPGDIATGTATYTVTQSEKDAGEVENTATVTGTPPFDPADPTRPGDPITPVPSTPDVDNPGTPGDPGIPTVVEVPAEPSLSLAKTGVLSAGGNTIEYTFTVTNTGNVTMTDIEVTDVKLPGGTVDTSTGTWPSTEGVLTPGESVELSATYTVTQPEKDAGEVENAATVTGTPPFDPADPTQPGEPITPVPSTPDVDNPGTPGDPGVPTVVEVPADPALSFAKTGVLSADGNTIEYTFTVTNTGNVTMTGVEITDAKLPDGVTLDATTLAPGDIATGTATYTITQPEKDAGNVENAATVTGTPPFDPADPTQPGEPIDPVPSTPDVDNPGTPGDPGIPTVVTVPADPALSFAKTGVLSTDGNTIEYTFTVTNTGNVTLTGVEITDAKLPDGVTLDATTLAPGAIATGTATYTITQPEKDAGEVENTATVTGTPPFDPTDPTQPGEPITPVPSTPDIGDPGTPGDPGIPTVVTVPADPSLSFAKTGVLSADGNTIEYTFTVTNMGNVTMEDVTVSDPKITGTITVTPTTLAPGAVATGTATYTITQPEKDAGEVENTATVTGTPPFDPADPTQPGEPITPVPSTPDMDNPGAPGDPEVPTVVDVPMTPSVALTKKVTSEGPYAINDFIDYDIVIHNTGNVTLTDVVVTDNNAEIVSGSPVASLAPNTAATVTARHQITQADINAGTVVNQATVTGDDPDGNPIVEVPSDNPDTPQPNDPTVVQLTQRPGLALTKRSTGEGPYTVDDYIDYEIVIRNTGNVTLTDVTVTDNNAEIIAGSPVASLLPGATATVTARHSVTQADVDAGTVVNQAKVTGNDPGGNPIVEVPSDDPDTPQPNDPTVVELTRRPTLTLTKRATGEGPYVVGDYIDYEITVRNTGNVTLTAVAVTDNNAEIVSGSPVASLAPNTAATVIARHQITQADINAGTVVNQAKVTGNDPDGNPIAEVPSDNPDTPQPNDPTVVELTQRPALTLTKRATSEGPYAVGEYIDYEITVRNTGNVTLTDVEVTDANAEITGGSPIASLTPNAAATIIARHRITQSDIDASTVVNQAKVSGNDPDGNPIAEVPSDNPDTPQPNDPTVVELTQRPAVALTKRATSEGPYTVGSYINYELTVRNIGNVTLTGVTVTDDNAEITAGTPIAQLAPNATATVLARHRITQSDIDAGTVVNQAKITGDDPDGNPIPEVSSDDPGTSEPDDPTVVHMESRPALSLTKGVTSEGPYDVGDQIKYFNIVVTNTGNVTLTDVVVTDDNAEIISGSPIARLRPGESAAVMAQHVVTQADMDAGEVINQARVSGNDPGGSRTPDFLSDDPNTPEPGDETITAIAQAPAVRIDKVADRELVEKAGDRIGYQLQVVNTGNVTLHDVEVTDPLTGFTQQIAQIRPGIVNAHTFRTTYVTTAADLVVGKVVNTATVTAVTPDGGEVTHTTTVEVEAYFKEIEVEDDDFGPVNGRTGGNVGNVFTNDKINGDPLVPGEVTLTRVPSDDPSPLVLEDDGTVTVTPNTPAGTYSFDYRVCDIINPNNCDVATVTVVVAPAEIKAVSDQVTGVNGYDGTSNVTNIFTNDQLDGAPIVPEEVTLTLINSDPALRLNPDGSVDVVPGTRGGTYTLEYQICEVLNPDNCSVATVTVTVVNPLKIPNVFTPNGDGRNDQFEIIGSEGFDRIEVTIVNRWGNEVYRSDNYQNDWSGQGLTEGTYYYLITTHLGSTEDVHKGWVLIKRL